MTTDTFLSKIFMTIPVTTCSVERSFSSLKRIKTPVQNSISDKKLTDSVLIPLDLDNIKVNADDVMAKKQSSKIEW